jgi:hypothetical protein
MLTTYHHPVPLSRNLGTLTFWNPLGHSRPVTGLLYLYCLIVWCKMSINYGLLNNWWQTRKQLLLSPKQPLPDRRDHHCLCVSEDFSWIATKLIRKCQWYSECLNGDRVGILRTCQAVYCAICTLLKNEGKPHIFPISVTVQHSVTPDCQTHLRISFGHRNVTDYER